MNKPAASPVGEPTITRSYPEQVFGLDGKAVKAGSLVKLPAPTARRFEARWGLKPADLDSSTASGKK